MDTCKNNLVWSLYKSNTHQYYIKLERELMVVTVDYGDKLGLSTLDVKEDDLLGVELFHP